jgi:hypothetical protein
VFTRRRKKFVIAGAAVGTMMACAGTAVAAYIVDATGSGTGSVSVGTTSGVNGGIVDIAQCSALVGNSDSTWAGFNPSSCPDTTTAPQPGQSTPVDVVFTGDNSDTNPVYVGTITTTIASTSDPTGCPTSNFYLTNDSASGTQQGGPGQLSVPTVFNGYVANFNNRTYGAGPWGPAGSADIYVVLGSLADGAWANSEPVLNFADTSGNQDGCAGVTVNLTFTAS